MIDDKRIEEAAEERANFVLTVRQTPENERKHRKMDIVSDVKYGIGWGRQNPKPVSGDERDIWVVTFENNHTRVRFYEPKLRDESKIIGNREYKAVSVQRYVHPARIAENPKPGSGDEVKSFSDFVWKMRYKTRGELEQALRSLDAARAASKKEDDGDTTTAYWVGFEKGKAAEAERVKALVAHAKELRLHCLGSDASTKLMIERFDNELKEFEGRG